MRHKNITRRHFLTVGATALLGSAFTKLSDKSYAEEMAQSPDRELNWDELPLSILSGTSLNDDSRSDHFGIAFQKTTCNLTQYIPVYPGLSLILSSGVWVGYSRNLKANASLQGATGETPKMRLTIPEGVYFLRGTCPNQNGVPRVWTQSLASYTLRCVEPLPELSAYTEITELHLDQRSRTNRNGNFNLEALDSPSIGDLFFTPIGTDIVVCFQNANIMPCLRTGENYTYTIRKDIFTPHFAPGSAWYHCKTTDVCVALEACFGTVGGVIKQLTVAELYAAEPRVFVRFPGKVLNTVNAARIRSLGIHEKYLKSFTVVHLTDVHGDMDSAHAIYTYADRIRADFVALTGDNCPSRAFHGYDILNTLIRNARTPTVYSFGNHDVANLTDAEAYEQGIAPIRAKLRASEEHPWYFRDLYWEGEYVRVISLYPFYDKSLSRVYGYYCKDQLQWLCETMDSTPDGGHIFILRHFSHHFTIPGKDSNMFYDYDASNIEDWLNQWLDMDRDPVPEIVDAFNERQAIHTTFTGSLLDGQEEIQVNYDFSNRGISEFIAYFTGHTHSDYVGYVRDSRTPQVVLGSMCNIGLTGTADYHAYTSPNCNRDYGTDSQIAFNVYTFDFENKKIYVARVGNGFFKDREKTYMELTYQ